MLDDNSRFLLDTLLVKTKAEQTVNDYKTSHNTMAKCVKMYSTTKPLLSSLGLSTRFHISQIIMIYHLVVSI